MITQPPSERSIFVAALQRPNAADRAAFLDEACGGNVELRRGVDALLREHEQLGSFLEAPAAGSAAAIGAPPQEGPGTVIGPYKLLEQIGEGGFGVVFLAEQTRPVRRKVALKVLKPGMDTRQVVARFEAERQALALMDHPNIAKVLDAGATPSGRPYFVMELVKGVPITDFCDQHQLTPRQRLQLFVSVCQAVQHAHQKGIIHRDLKPSNVLVTVHDTTPVVKVIDFGVVKALGQELTDKTLCTGFAQVIGTPLYMSPEQAGQSGLDVDTRTDVYALGVLLYELLTGTTPFDQERLRTAGFDEMRRIIREEEPARPSTRISTLGQAGATVSANRQSDPKRLSQLFRGELDWIVMKALEKDRSRRYETASAFAQDVQRYLHDEPVLACPPSAGYRLRKFARRNKRALVTAALLGVMLLAAVAARLQAEAAAREKLERNLYYMHIATAERNQAAGNVAWAEELLDQCPEPLRGWEWHYLKRRRYGDPPALRHDGPLYRTAFSPDCRQIAAGAQDGTVLVWDAGTGNPLYTLPEGQGMPVHHLTYSPDSRYLAAAMHTGRVLVWDATRGERLPTLEAHQGRIWQVAFGPDSRQLASTGNDGNIRLWDVTSGKEVGSLPRQEVPAKGVVFRPDGRLLSAGADGTVKVWDPATGRELSSYRGSVKYVGLALFSPDGRRLAWATNEGIVKVWDTATGQEQCTLQGHTFDVRGVAFSPDGQRLATAGFDKTIRLWDAATGRETLTIHGHPDGVNNVAFSPDGRRLISASYDHTLRIWDATPLTSEPPTGAVLTLSGQPHLLSVAFSPNGQQLAAGSLDGTVTVWDAASGRQAWSIRAHADHARGVAFSADGRLLASASWDGTVKLWDAATGRERRPLSLRSEGAASVAFSPDGRLLAAGTWGGAVLWDTTTWEQVGAPLKQSTSPVPSVAFAPDSRRLITAGASQRNAQLWDVSARAVIRTLEGHGSPVGAVAFSPDGKVIATGSNDKTVKVWDAATGEEIHTLRGHAGYVGRAAFSPDGRYLASGSWDSTVKVWDPATGREVCTLRGHAGTISGVAFRPDGKRLASASGYAGHGEIRVWDASLWENQARGER
jgi:WD40 repeat protein/serine/threonine protein kinase